jgi:hypothetical protein
MPRGESAFSELKTGRTTLERREDRPVFCPVGKYLAIPRDLTDGVLGLDGDEKRRQKNASTAAS